MLAKVGEHGRLSSWCEVRRSAGRRCASSATDVIKLEDVRGARLEMEPDSGIGVAGPTRCVQVGRYRAPQPCRRNGKNGLRHGFSPVRDGTVRAPYEPYRLPCSGRNTGCGGRLIVSRFLKQPFKLSSVS
jgi:hypothetical protein